MLTSAPSPDSLQSPMASTLLNHFQRVRAATLSFTAPLSAEDMMVQSCSDASPVKWHLAHTSWFFETFVLGPYASEYRRFHSDFHWLFNSYYSSLGDMPAKNLRASFSRPPLADILAYRHYVNAAIETLLNELPPELEDVILRRVTLGLQHEQQHLELIASDIKHALYTNPLHPPYQPQTHMAEPSASLSEAAFHLFPGGLTEVGLSPESADPLAFAFDNETPRHTVFLQPYLIASRLVTAGEYLAFINDNGYTRPELWLSEGWSAMRSAGWQAPLYWQRTSDSASGWRVFTLKGWKPLDALLETPVCHLSFFEADAFARWSGSRLPTEFEWEHACLSSGGSPLRCPPALTDAANMLESGELHPRPPQANASPQQFFGDVWEWTASPYTGYPGYKPLPGALGEYNGKFMSSQIILRGGSCVTPSSHIRATYRNFFPPAARWQFSGLRLAKDA